MVKKSIEVRNLTFTYSGSDEPALKDVSFDVGCGEILLVIGQSGCGKTTLLQHLKTSYLPEGKRTSSSKIRIDGTLIEDMSEEEQAFKVGYVGQQVEASQVTDKVWHELAFGLESLSKSQDYIRCRVCEVAAFFGLEQVFHSKLSELSGGQKQLVNLASIMIMEPEILVLDEPTSQLDPMSAEEFFRMIRKVHDELGTTIVIAEHRLESIYGDADNVMVLDGGSLLTCGTPGEVSRFLYEKEMSLFRSLPVSVRLYYDAYFKNSNNTEGNVSDIDADGYDESYEKHKAPPLTVNSGRTFLKSLVEDGEFLEGTALEKRIVNEDATIEDVTIENASIENASAENASIKRIKSIKDETVLVAEEIWFRYKKDSQDVLKACSFMLPKGKITALLGGNGAGKSTLLYVLAGYLSPYIGRVKSYDVKIGVLPQEPKSMFAKKTVAEELGIFVNKKVNAINNSEDHVEKSRAEKIAEFFDLSDSLMKHPFDLSGGQQQKLAMAKLVLGDYDIFLLDEPGKGMDYAFKEKMGIYLKELADKGKTILTVSHDVEFAAAYADYCGLFFDGNVVSLEDTRAFFSQNVFYTTAVRRMSREIVDAVIYKELLDFFCEKDQDAGKISLDEDDSENIAKLSNEKEDNDRSYKLIKDISEGNSGEKEDIKEINERSIEKNKEYADVSDNHLETNDGENAGEEKEHLTLRRLIIPALVFFLLMPLTIYLGHSVLHQRKYYFISLMLILEGIGAFMIGFERGKPKLKEIMTIAVMSAITALSRAAFYMIPAVKPMAALTIISGIGLGAVPGFLVGALSMLVSDIFFGQGPWTPWQMFTMGLIGFLAGAVFRRKREFDKKRRIDITVFGLLVVFFVYGGIMNPASVLMYQENVSWEMLLASYAPGIPIDAIHAVSTAVFLWLGAGPMLEKIERVRKK